MIPHIFLKGHFALLMKIKIMQGGSPELSRTTHNTVTIKGGINLSIELQKHKLNQIAARNIRIFRQAYSFLKVNLQRLRREMYEGKYDTRDKNLPTVLANSSNHSRARRHDIECK